MLGQILKETRQSAGMTQEALAHGAGVDRSYISQLERDLKSPTVQMLFLLCDALQASPAAVIGKLEAALSAAKRGK